MLNNVCCIKFVEQCRLLHVKDTNPTTYVCDILIFHKG